ncbi:hypothetical protein [Acidisoma sp. 7E03]
MNRVAQPETRRGRAVVTIINCLLFDHDASAGCFIEATALLGLNGADLKHIYDHIPSARTVRVPKLGRIA